MSAPTLQPIVIWFGRVGDMILLSALLEILHRRFGRPCLVVGAGEWTAQIYEQHPDVAGVLWVRRYTPFLLDARWWQAVRTLARHRHDPVSCARAIRASSRAFAACCARRASTPPTASSLPITRRALAR